jgi:hypothetical protein
MVFGWHSHWVMAAKQTIMKKINLTILFLSLVLSAAFAENGEKKEQVKVLSTKREIFYFKVEKKLIGATVEILDENQQVVKTEQIVNKKTIIDFFFLEDGNYTVSIKKDCEQFNFKYTNRNSNPSK